jgi:hypothetical protein
VMAAPFCLFSVPRAINGWFQPAHERSARHLIHQNHMSRSECQRQPISRCSELKPGSQARGRRPVLGDFVEICETDGYPIVYGEKYWQNQVRISLWSLCITSRPMEFWLPHLNQSIKPLIFIQKPHFVGACDDKGNMHVKALNTWFKAILCLVTWNSWLKVKKK